MWRRWRDVRAEAVKRGLVDEEKVAAHRAGYWHQGEPLVGDDSEPHPLDADGVQPDREQ